MGSSTGEVSVITSSANARVKQLRAAFAGQARLSGGLVAIEGENLLGEALRSGMVLKTVFLSERLAATARRDVPSMLPGGLEVLCVAHELFQSVVETESPQGIAALMVPPVHTIEAAMAAMPLVLVAAGLQDPGNLGTLIRSAEAFGATGVFTTPGTVSAWNQKVIRASAGSIFRVPVVGVTIEELTSLKLQGLKLLAAIAEPSDSRGVLEAHEAPFANASAILIGNEGNGLTDELLTLADHRVTISCPGRVESLNAAIAGSLLLYEASRQRVLESKTVTR